MKMVEDVVKNWKQMEGATDEIKRLNSLLTATFVMNDCPADECLAEARHIAALFRAGVDWKAETVKYLRSMFATSYKLADVNRQAEPSPIPGAYPACDKAADRIEALFKDGR